MSKITLAAANAVLACFCWFWFVDSVSIIMYVCFCVPVIMCVRTGKCVHEGVCVSTFPPRRFVQVCVFACLSPPRVQPAT
jgi:hypothetical protein